MFPQVRPRRSRSSPWIRNLVAEHVLTRHDLVMPFFVREGKAIVEPVQSMPGVYRYSIDELLLVIQEAIGYGLRVFAVFPVVDKHLKSADARESYNPENLICRTIKAIKSKFSNDLSLIADVALDPYTPKGHDGILRDGIILNDETVEILGRQSLILAASGCDIVAPSDMMDGRVGYIRKILDNSNFIDVIILSYSVKYASSFYKPFRCAIGSNLAEGIDKSTYQMDFANSHEAIREVALDIHEGADLILLKPSMLYLDIIHTIKNKFHHPIIAYQVSREYSLLIEDMENMYESLLSLKRAGSNAIITYAALKLVKENLVL